MNDGVFNSGVSKYLERISSNEKMRFLSKITKLKEKGISIIQSGTYEKVYKELTGLCKEGIVIQIKYSRHRVICFVYEELLHIIHAFKKQSNKTPPKEKNIIKKRINMIIKKFRL